MTSSTAPTTVEVVAPITGTIIDITDVPDPVFAKKSVGDGFGISAPPGGTVVSPVTGTVMMVAKTRHAVGIKTESGLQFLVHLGIDTVELDGNPFTLTVTKGDKVEAGQIIGTMDVGAIKEGGKDTTTVVAVTNTAKKLDHIDVDEGPAEAGDKVAVAHAKVKPSTPPESSDSAAASAKEPAPVDSSRRPANLTGYDALAWDIIDNIGGKENVRSVTHCITRVRFYLKDNHKAKTDIISNLDGIIDVVQAGGQYQVVIGAEVEDVYNAIVPQLGDAVAAGGDDGPETPKPTTAWGWVKFGFSSLIGVITGSMIPVIGLLAASGIIKGILSLLLTFEIVDKETSTYIVINAMSDSVFFFLPIFVGFTAAKRLGSDPIIVAIIGGVLTYPDVLTLAEKKGDTAILGMSLNADFFGLPYHVASYSYSIFPIIVAAWFASIVEPWLKKIVPTVVRSIFVPLLEVIIVSTAILLILGPIVTFISGGIAGAITGLYSMSSALSGLVVGGFYQALVIFGLHWAVIPLVAQDIAQTGHSYLNAIISVTMVAQGAAVLAVFVKSRIKKIKELSLSAAISAFCGVTEPAMYGINLKYGRVFLMGSIGGAVGGLVTGLLNVNMWGFTGSIIGFTSFVNPEGVDSSFQGFWIASIVSIAVAFTLTYMFGFTDTDVEGGREVKKVRLGNREPAHK